MSPAKIIFIILVYSHVFGDENCGVMASYTTDPYKIAGEWYAVAVITPRSDFPQFRCWKVHILETDSNSYLGISHFTDTVTNERKLAFFKATIYTKHKTFIVLDVSLTYGISRINFKIYHMLMRPELLALSMIGNDTKFFDAFIMSTSPTLSDNDQEMLRAEIYIDNIDCPSDQKAQIANVIENYEILTKIMSLEAQANDKTVHL